MTTASMVCGEEVVVVVVLRAAAAAARAEARTSGRDESIVAVVAILGNTDMGNRVAVACLGRAV